jgi:hypothetical protein
MSVTVGSPNRSSVNWSGLRPRSVAVLPISWPAVVPVAARMRRTTG